MYCRKEFGMHVPIGDDNMKLNVITFVSVPMCIQINALIGLLLYECFSPYGGDF